MAIVKLAPVSDQDSMRDTTRSINKNFIRLAQMISDITERPQSFKQEVTVETEDGETVQVASGIASAGEAAKNAQDTATASKVVAENAEAAAAEASELASLADLAAQAAKTTADAAQGDATAALSNAATAQGTADRAISDAAAAYGTASNALGNAAAAQSSADQANGVLDQTIEQYADNTFSVGKSTGWNVWIGAANNAAGIFIREAQKIWAAFTQSAVAFYDGNGIAEANQTAFFGNSSARIGKKAGTHVEIDSDGVGVCNGEEVLASFGIDTAMEDPDGDVLEAYVDIHGLRFGREINNEAGNSSRIEGGDNLLLSGGGVLMSFFGNIIRAFSDIYCSGNLNVSGNITAMGHSGFIGSYDTVSSGGKRSFASGTSWAQTGVEKTLSEGRYMVVASAVFSANATGRRGACIGVDETTYTHSMDTRTAVNGAVTRINVSAIVTIVGSGTVQLMAFQNSGSALSVADSSMRIIRIV